MSGTEREGVSVYRLPWGRSRYGGRREGGRQLGDRISGAGKGWRSRKRRVIRRRD
ncbi:hypothetical protein [Halalkalicoccus subterraneus]|uniref:hypothetical protein n=1 Tax=Halalkalicoccus subterraneus TaxID=2675002 RepID=UPI0013CEAE11|nr:hypothetical protein [Halalkalicoccus subterraneus]